MRLCRQRLGWRQDKTSGGCRGTFRPRCPAPGNTPLVAGAGRAGTRCLAPPKHQWREREREKCDCILCVCIVWVELSGVLSSNPNNPNNPEHPGKCHTYTERENETGREGGVAVLCVCAGRAW